ncbi:MAG: hypothetical protein IPG45_18130 [Deltaproteobacteria bacterium]|nr:hypothetical protein [Deltaproteobacteria bacterium]
MASENYVVGNVYFAITFLDEDERLIPVVETVIYLGTGAIPSEEPEHHFQDAESHAAGVRFEDASSAQPHFFLTFPQGRQGPVYELSKAIDVLKECQERRQSSSKGGGGF